MALSNTAVPKYYGAFRDAVLNGEIPVCKEIEAEMNRIDNLIRSPDYYYDDRIVDGWIAFCEGELTLTDGSNLHMLDSFKLWGEQVFGWYYFVPRDIPIPDYNGNGVHYETRWIKTRLINKQFLIVGRGAAKSLYDTCIQAYYENIDTSATQQATVAPTMRQAEEVVLPYSIAITRARGPLFQFLTEGSLQNTTGNRADRVKLASTKKGIQNFLNGSILEIKPMTIDKIQGSRARIWTMDEWLSCDIRENPINAAAEGASKHDDWLIVATSSEGTVRNGPGDDIKMLLQKILRGEYDDPHTSIFWYKLDDVKEINDPNMWVKANPNLGKTVKWDIYQREVVQAEQSPAARNDTLAKRFGIPMEGYTYFFRYEETLLHPWKSCDGMPCAMGADLSQGDDFCAFTFLFPLRDGSYRIKTRNYISMLTLMRLPSSMRKIYDQFRDEGSLCVLEGSVLDMMEVYDDLDKFIQDHEYDVCAFGYDPYNAREFVERWAAENGPYGIEKVIQGAKTESVPLGEIKKMAEERLLLFDEELMKFAMGNCVTLEDTNGNRKLFKKRREQKIDAVAALLDAYVAYKLHKEAFE